MPIDYRTTATNDPCQAYEQDEKKFYEALLVESHHAYTCLYSRIHNPFMEMVFKRGGNQDEALDVLQDCIAIFLDNLRSGKYQFQADAKITTYLYRICLNKWYEYVNKRTKQGEQPFDENRQSNDGFDDDDSIKPADIKGELADDDTDEADKTAWVNRLNEAMSLLTHDCQKMLYWFYVDDLSLREIGKHLNITEESAAVKRFRCAKYLRDRYKSLF